MSNTRYLISNGVGKLIGLILLLTQLHLVQAATDCSTVTQIPLAECEVLIDLYNSTNGPNWTDNTGWNVTNTPCQWKGVKCSGGRVTSLSLMANNLSGSIPDSLGKLSSLQSLYLSDNQLSGSIPESIGKLRSLSLRNNQLSGSIPNALGNLSSLHTLYLDGNQLCGEIPLSLMNLPLSSLGLHYNHLTASNHDLINWLKQKNPTWARTQTPCPQSQACLVYALNDDGLNNTQFFTINPDEDFKVIPLETLHLGYDIEAMDIALINSRTLRICWR